MRPTLQNRLLGLNIRNRHSKWLQHYPKDFWQAWHMSLLGHNPRPTEHPVTHMYSLYRKDNQKTPAAQTLISFEARTLLGHLPSQTGTTENLLLDFAQDLNTNTSSQPFWTSLQSHYNKHVVEGDSGIYLRAASVACMQHLSITTGQSIASLSSSDPGNLTTPEEYGRLARIITLIAVSAERPFRFTLYCSYGDYEPYHGLSLNIYIPQDFLAQYGVLSEREVLVGITLGSQNHVAGSHGGVYVPLLVPEQNFSTLFAPKSREGARMYADGRSAILIL